MKYIEILEQHGIIVSLEDKANKFCTNIFNSLPFFRQDDIPFANAFDICQRIGIRFDEVVTNPNHPINTPTFMKVILFHDTVRYGCRPVGLNEFFTRISIMLQDDFFVDEKDNLLLQIVEDELERWGLPYIVCAGIILPKGVKEFDEALVADIAKWLCKYPSAHKTYINALQQYCENAEPRDIADNLRKSLEDFLKEFLGNAKNLNSNINEAGAYLKTNGVNEEIRGMFTTLIKHYDKLNNKTAKHHNATDTTDTEFLLYQTGIFMRYLLVIRQNFEMADAVTESDELEEEDGDE